MIVLARRPHESLMIGDAITVLVVEVRGDTVRLAVNAPKSLPVRTREMFETFQSEMLRQEATKRRTTDVSIGQRLKNAIGASGQRLDRLAVQLGLPEDVLENFLRRDSDLPLSIVQRIAAHFQLRLIGPDSDEAGGA
jgi:carbon storage regulator